MSPHCFIAAERGHYPVQRMCQVLGVPASGYYAWQAAQQRAAGRPKTPAWETALVQVVGMHQRRYGTRRLQVDEESPGHLVQEYGFVHLLPTRRHIGTRGIDGCELVLLSQGLELVEGHSPKYGLAAHSQRRHQGRLASRRCTPMG